jgi:hypothetical protein
MTLIIFGEVYITSLQLPFTSSLISTNILNYSYCFKYYTQNLTLPNLKRKVLGLVSARLLFEALINYETVCDTENVWQ